MKFKKITAMFLSLCLVGGTASLINANVPMVSSAAVDEKYTVGSYDDFKYAKYSDHIEIGGFNKNSETAVVPDNIEGLPVTGFMSYAFSGCEKLRSVTLPNSISSISGGLFLNCTSLTSVNIPPSVTEVSSSAFHLCTSLTSITIPKNVSKIGEGAFAGCMKLSKIVIENPNCEISDFNHTICNNYEMDNFYNFKSTFSGTIYGYADSTAQAYAEKYGYKFEAITLLDIGDVNSDGAVNALDASMVLTDYSAIATGKESVFNEAQKISADVNNDGAVDALDASNILSYYSFTATGGKGTLAEYLNK